MMSISPFEGQHALLSGIIQCAGLHGAQEGAREGGRVIIYRIQMTKSKACTTGRCRWMADKPAKRPAIRTDTKAGADWCRRRAEQYSPDPIAAARRAPATRQHCLDAGTGRPFPRSHALRLHRPAAVCVPIYTFALRPQNQRAVFNVHVVGSAFAVPDPRIVSGKVGRPRCLGVRPKGGGCIPRRGCKKCIVLMRLMPAPCVCTHVPCQGWGVRSALC
jgi:hypothetical protein